MNTDIVTKEEISEEMETQDSSNPLDFYYEKMKTDNSKTSDVSRKSSLFSRRKKVENVDATIDDVNKLIVKAEKQKHSFRRAFVIFIGILLTVQLFYFNLVVYHIVSAIIVKSERYNSLSPQVIDNLLSFLKYYISVTVVELLGMLAFIVHYAFSKVSFLSSGRKKKK